MTKHNISAASVKKLSALLLTCAGLILIAPVLWPEMDLTVSGWFYRPGEGFPLARQPILVALHWLATIGVRFYVVFLLIALGLSHFKREPFLGIKRRGWLFVLLGLLLAPGLIANVTFKDHWGRARPHEVTEFGGSHPFSPALVPQENARSNGSFVAGDPSFGFYLSSFGYVVAPNRSRRFFWGGMGSGVLLGLTRIAMGAHFLSDVLFAALFMLAATAGLHMVMFGSKKTKHYWRIWLSGR